MSPLLASMIFTEKNESLGFIVPVRLQIDLRFNRIRYRKRQIFNVHESTTGQMDHNYRSSPLIYRMKVKQIITEEMKL